MSVWWHLHTVELRSSLNRRLQSVLNRSQTHTRPSLYHSTCAIFLSNFPFVVIPFPST